MVEKILKTIARKENTGYWFVLPALLFMIGLVGFPVIYNLIISTYNVNVITLGMHSEKFVGLQNYINLFNDPTMRTSILNTFIFTIGSIILQFVIGFALAILFHMNFKISKFLRGIMLISWMIPVTVTALLFKFMLSPSGGVIDAILLNLHLISKPIGWFVDPNMSMWSVIIANTWIGIPFNLILLTTGLSNIPAVLYEAAEVDGAKISQRFFYITIPQMRASMLSVLILGVIYTSKVFDLIFVSTGGGPLSTTEVLSTYSYRLSFSQFSFSEGAAVANVLFFILVIVSIGYIKLINKDEVMS
jgi:multiple sugar transport system permease protein